MPSFRLLNQAPQYLLRTGLVNAGGSLRFFESDLTTPKNTWSDEAMTVLNPNPVTMDSAGRTQTDVWGDGTYGVVMADRDGVVQWTRNNVQASAGTGTALPDPAGHAGEYLLSNGSTYVLEEKYELPDPTGLNNYQLVSDGTGWIPQQIVDPTVPDPEIVVAANSFRAGVSTDTTKFFVQTGSGTAPSSGTATTSLSISYPVAFSTVTHVSLTPTTNSQPGGPVVAYLSAASSTTGCTAQFDVAEGNGGSPTIINPVPFTWMAVGTKVI